VSGPKRSTYVDTVNGIVSYRIEWGTWYLAKTVYRRTDRVAVSFAIGSQHYELELQFMRKEG